ncbi:TPA: hypothetical protein QDB04_002238 [Burkholderia vietnamiensis]|nr:hypothetical protein [Burkholderia vietnamiensis]
MKAPFELVVQVETADTEIEVLRAADGRYHVVRDGVNRRPNASAEDVMRTLGNYLQSALQGAR